MPPGRLIKSMEAPAFTANRPPGRHDPRASLAAEPMGYFQMVAVALATALNALDGFDILSISFAAPGIATQWHVDKAALGIVLSMELIGMGVGSLILGRAADRFGRRPLTLACLLIMTAGMMLAGSAPGIGLLSVYRLATGIGIGGMLATTNAIVAEFANAQRRNLSVIVMGSGYPLGAIVGGLIVARILAAGGTWHSIFHVGALFTMVFIPLVWFLLPETIAFLLYARPVGALDRINRSLRRMGKQQIAALPDLDERGARSRLSELFGPDLKPATLLLGGSYVFQIMTFYFLLKWIPKLVVDFGYPVTSAAHVLVWANVGGVIGSLVLSLMTQRFSIRTLTATWMVMGSASVILFGQGHGGPGAMSLVAAVGDFFLNGANVGLYAMIAQSFPARLRAGATGLLIGAGRAGAALGPILGGFFLNAGLPIGIVALIMSAGSLVAALAILSLRYRETALA